MKPGKLQPKNFMHDFRMLRWKRRALLNIDWCLISLNTLPVCMMALMVNMSVYS